MRAKVFAKPKLQGWAGSRITSRLALKQGVNMSNRSWMGSVGALLIAFSILALVGCGGPNREIVGKWHAASDATVVWEFFDNGSMQMGDRPGRYSFQDRTRLQIKTSAATFVYGIDLAGDHMTLKETKGEKLEFTKVK
jgi:hypothetical protein